MFLQKFLLYLFDSMHGCEAYSNFRFSSSFFNAPAFVTRLAGVTRLAIIPAMNGTTRAKSIEFPKICIKDAMLRMRKDVIDPLRADTPSPRAMWRVSRTCREQLSQKNKTIIIEMKFAF